MKFKDYLWILTTIFGSILGYILAMATEIFKNRRQRVDDVRSAINKLIAQYHESVKFSFQNKDQGPQNTIGWFLGVVENPNDNCITACSQAVSKSIYDSSVSIDFIHRHIINLHYNNITKYINSNLNKLSEFPNDKTGNDFMANELNKIKIRDFRIGIIISGIIIILALFVQSINYSQDILAYHYERYNNIDKRQPGFYIDNSSTEKIYIDSIIIKTEIGKFKICNDSTWTCAITHLGMKEQLNDLENPYHGNKPLIIQRNQTLPFIACKYYDCHHTVPEAVKTNIYDNLSMIYFRKNNGKRFELNNNR